MAAPTNTLLIEGSFEELADELAQYIDSLRKSPAEGATLQSEVAALIEEGKKDDVLKKIVGNAAILNSAPEKGEYYLSTSNSILATDLVPSLSLYQA
jgi:translation initiation factor 3 subunit M